MFYKVLGLMSGTSLDGLDMAYCEFDIVKNNINYSIKKATTIPYDNQLRDKIKYAPTYSAEQIFEFSSLLGHYWGKLANRFIVDNDLDIDFISCSGQTIFHQPDKGFTTQIGDLNALASQTNCMVIGDFRSLDVAFSGQGAPLVPIGDQLLFGLYDSCVNIGGFSNISFDKQGKRLAFDICPCNIVLNRLAQTIGLPYDKDGLIAQNSKVDNILLDQLNNIHYYNSQDKYSLSEEWLNDNVIPILNQTKSHTETIIATYTKHIAIQIAKQLKGKTLLTGGGAENKFLVSLIRQLTSNQIIVPDTQTIRYKEALIFAFLGIRRLEHKVNCLSAVTKAKQNCCSGTIVLGYKENKLSI